MIAELVNVCFEDIEHIFVMKNPLSGGQSQNILSVDHLLDVIIWASLAADIEFGVVYILGVRLIPNVSTETQSQYVLTHS
mgnify:FL=1